MEENHHPPSPDPTTSSDPPSIPTVHMNGPIQPSDNPPSKPQINGLKPPRKIKKRTPLDTSSSSSSSFVHSNYIINNNNNNHSNSPQRGIKILNNKRRNNNNNNNNNNPKFSVKRNHSDVEAIAFPLGMSIAAVLAQVLERKDLSTESTSVEHLSMICTSAVRESLTNVFGNKFDAFARNFEKSFGSTLSTIRLVRNSSMETGETQVGNKSNDNSAFHPDTTPAFSLIRGECSSRSFDIADGCMESLKCTFEASGCLRTVEGTEDGQPAESRNQELLLQEVSSLQLCRAISDAQGYFSKHSVLSTFHKSVSEQTRANDLKSLEIGLIRKKLQLKESQLALHSDLNFLERCKLSLGSSKMSFKTEKFKNQLEETRLGDLLKTCADCLVSGLLTMAGCLGYGVYAFSYEKLRELTKACYPSEVKSWSFFRPMASFNSGLQTISCQVQVYSRIIFGVLLIGAIGLLLIQRTGISNPTMPVTFLVLLLGGLGGFVGKFSVDTLGGNGYLWLIYWEIMCILHFLANVCTPFLFYILNGTVQVSQGTKCHSVFPFWMRRCLFYFILLCVPVCCGLLPFANPKTWWEEHFSKVIRNHLLVPYGETYDDWSGLHE